MSIWWTITAVICGSALVWNLTYRDDHGGGYWSFPDPTRFFVMVLAILAISITWGIKGCMT